MSDLFACDPVCTGERARLDMPTSVTRWHARAHAREGSPVRRCTDRSLVPLSLRPPVCRSCLSSAPTCLCAPRQSTDRRQGATGENDSNDIRSFAFLFLAFVCLLRLSHVRMDDFMPLTYEKVSKKCVSNKREFIRTYAVNGYTYPYLIHSQCITNQLIRMKPER